MVKSAGSSLKAPAGNATTETVVAATSVQRCSAPAKNASQLKGAPGLSVPTTSPPTTTDTVPAWSR